MIKLLSKAFDLPLKHAFTISRGSVSVQQSLIVQASSGGKHGYGEATTNEYYGVSIDGMQAAIEEVTSFVKSSQPQDIPHLLTRTAQQLCGRDRHRASFALCALDLALHDLWGKLHDAPLHALWGLDATRLPESNLTIGIDTLPKMVAKLKEEPDWPLYKIKLGTPEDIVVIEELRRHTDAPFRVDANCGWTVEKTIALSTELKELGVEFIEQPLPSEDRDGMRIVYQESVLPVIADESCVSEEDVDRCAGSFHGVNIKLVKCGGLAPARRMIDRARGLGLRVMVGCMTESTVGVSAIAQLLPLLDYVDMDGACLLAKDVAAGARVERGRCVLPSRPGCGVGLFGGPLTNAGQSDGWVRTPQHQGD